MCMKCLFSSVSNMEEAIFDPVAAAQHPFRHSSECISAVFDALFRFHGFMTPVFVPVSFTCIRDFPKRQAFNKKKPLHLFMALID